ncbi:MAG: hypothetical protein AAFN08_05570 [Cyanobacteria bacterium J06559_3]
MTNSNQNGNSSDRLDRIEVVLERITNRLDQVSEAGQRTDARLDRVSDRLDQVSQSGQQTDARLERIAAAVQDERIQRAEDYNELRNAIATTNQVVAATNQAVETTNRRIDAFITENRANWERYERHKAENDLRFNNMLADARADRAAMRRQQEAFEQTMEHNRRDHEEFRAAIRSLFDRQPEDEGDNR